jgi:hypothetical protein
LITGQEMTQLYARLPVQPAASTDEIVNGNVPVTVGVPERMLPSRK